MKIGDTVKLIRPYRISTAKDPENPKSGRLTQHALIKTPYYWAYTLRNSRKNQDEKIIDRKTLFTIPRNLIFGTIDNTNPPISGEIVSFHKMPNMRTQKAEDYKGEITDSPDIWAKIVYNYTYLFIPVCLLEKQN
ncbi:hypothetical protein EKK58_07865 [Candidatus Dependentiae bacterium]|nr:MAG: hypothetical protein EKK58_07865 [Candidatus Dependentiae bacterium]